MWAIINEISQSDIWHRAGRKKEGERERRDTNKGEKKITVARTTQQVELIKTRNLSVSFLPYFYFFDCWVRDESDTLKRI